MISLNNTSEGAIYLEQPYLIHANVNDVLPNPLNPRKNDSVKTDDMQALIKTRGWEIPVSAYKQGEHYILLAGHRRLFAAKHAGMATIPVYVTPAPVDEQEELLRIGSLQRGQIDWAPYEWAKFSYDRWIAWNRPKDIGKFGREQLGLKSRTVRAYISVMDYFKDDVSQNKLSQGVWSFNVVDELLAFVRRMSQDHYDLLQSLGEKYVVKSLTNKMERGVIGRNGFRNTKPILDQASDEQLRMFFIEPNMTFQELADSIGVNDGDAVITFHGAMISLGRLNQRIVETEVSTKKDQDTFKAMLDKIIREATIRKELLDAAI